jgi:CheY-like chemotaxis protein
VNLLLIEDDPNDVLFFTRACRTLGFRAPPVVRSDGEEALAYLSAERPDAVILDLKLPKLSGLEVLERIRSTPRLADLPVYALTSSGEPSDVARAARLGVKEYLTKPTSYADLLEVVRRIRGENELDFSARARYSDRGSGSEDR